MYRLDRTAFKIQTFNESGKNRSYWMSKTPEERWAAAAYLIASAWGYDPQNPPRLDRTCFSIRKHE